MSIATPATDKEGYLLDLEAWTPQVADAIAAAEGLDLTPAHWEIIDVVRSFYAAYELSPAMRVLVKATRERLGPEKGSSMYLLTLFPGNPAKLAAKIGGLPRPTNCI